MDLQRLTCHFEYTVMWCTFSALSVDASVTCSNWSTVRGILLLFFIPSLNFPNKVIVMTECTHAHTIYQWKVQWPSIISAPKHHYFLEWMYHKCSPAHSDKTRYTKLPNTKVTRWLKHKQRNMIMYWWKCTCIKYAWISSAECFWEIKQP